MKNCYQILEAMHISLIHWLTIKSQKSFDFTFPSHNSFVHVRVVEQALLSTVSGLCTRRSHAHQLSGSCRATSCVYKHIQACWKRLDASFPWNVKLALCSLHARHSRTDSRQEFPENPPFLCARIRLWWVAQRSDSGLNLDGSRPEDLWNVKSPKTCRRICPKYSEVTLQLHAAFRIWKPSGLSPDRHLSQRKLQTPSISLNIHHNPMHSDLRVKDRRLFPVFPPNRWFRGATAAPLAAGPVSKLMWTKAEAQGVRGKPGDLTAPTGPAAFRNTTAQCSPQFVSV